MTKLLQKITILLLLFLLGCGYFKKIIREIPQNTGNISGCIKNKDTYNPIPDVLIICNNKEITSNNDGYYFFEGVKIGKQTLLLKKLGYEEQAIAIEVIQGKINLQPDIYLNGKKTELSGELTKNTIWTQNESLIYLVSGILKVPQNITLTIEKGVKVQFESNEETKEQGGLEILGKLVIKGDFSSSCEVTFTKSLNTSDFWQGIRFYEGSSGEISDCIIEYGENGIYAYQATQLNFKNCKIRYNNNSGIYCLETPFTIKKCEIEYNKNGIYCKIAPDIIYISQNIIRNNYLDGIYCEESNVKIEKNSFIGNGGNGISYIITAKSQIGTIFKNNIENNGKSEIKNNQYAVKGSGTEKNAKLPLIVGNCYIAYNDGKKEIVSVKNSNQKTQTQCEEKIWVLNSLEKPVNIYEE